MQSLDGWDEMRNEMENKIVKSIENLQMNVTVVCDTFIVDYYYCCCFKLVFVQEEPHSVQLSTILLSAADGCNCKQ